MTKKQYRTKIYIEYVFKDKNNNEHYFDYDLPFEYVCDGIRHCFDLGDVEVNCRDKDLWNICVEFKCLNTIVESEAFINYCKKEYETEAYEEWLEEYEEEEEDSDLDEAIGNRIFMKKSKNESDLEDDKLVENNTSSKTLSVPVFLYDSFGNEYQVKLEVNVENAYYDKIVDGDLDIEDIYFTYDWNKGYLLDKDYFKSATVWDNIKKKHVSISYDEYEKFAYDEILPKGVTPLETESNETRKNNAAVDYTTYQGEDLTTIKELLTQDAWDGYYDDPYLYEVEEPNEDDYDDYDEYEKAYKQFKKDLAEEINILVNNTLDGIKAIHVEDEVKRIEPYGPSFWGVEGKSVVELKDGRIFVVDDESDYSLFNVCELVIAREVDSKTFDLNKFFS